ncbi:MAG: hypothetical protein CTY28_11625 [Hyphomicrobium sp.]|nr:MAG: hypothetical protein CTY28_11625 [Hyphomicrobium sp.]
MSQSIIKFLRQTDYGFIRELGQGACGQTVLLEDVFLDKQFVCKKYSPQLSELRSELFQGFTREIKLLFDVYHLNIVRIFNYFVFPDKFAGFIIMEYVDGENIDDYVARQPQKINDVFQQVIDGFCHLESKGILHRDIRPSNILVRKDGIVKIIDLGFGKQIAQKGDFEKSITLNWWCDPPKEFGSAKYDFSTEVYFVGKLFERLGSSRMLNNFENKSVIGKMCQDDPAFRIASSSSVRQQMGTKKFSETAFSEREIEAYRGFSAAVSNHITKIDGSAVYQKDPDMFHRALEDAYQKVMLEEYAPDCAPILRSLLSGTYYYKRDYFPVEALGEFLIFLRSCTDDKRRIILANLHTKLDGIPRKKPIDPDDEIPF